MSEDKFKFRIDRSVLFLNIRIVLTVIVFVSVSSIIMFNTTYLNDFIAQRTKKFAHDLTYQHAANINKEFNTRMLNINMIADSLVQTGSTANNEILDEFLQRKAELSVFNELYFVGIEDIPQEIPDSRFSIPYHEIYLPHLHLLHDTENPNHSCITYDGSGNLYYTQQIFDGRRILGLLIGTRHKNDLQDLMQLRALDNNTISCIIDSNTSVVAAPTSDHLPSNTHLDHFILFEDTEESRLVLEALRNDISKVQAGVYTVKNANSQENILISYNPLNINDWGVISFIPEKLIAVDSHRYVVITFAISVLAISLFALITITAFLSYKKNKRDMEKIAFYDPVTYGLNDKGFQLRFQELVAKARPHTYSIILINMRHFKLINEQYGKEAGNKTLRHIHNCISKNLRNAEFASRDNADRFFICLREHRLEAIEGRLRAIHNDLNAFNKQRETSYPLDFNCGAKIVEHPHNEVILIQDHARLAYDLAVQENKFCVFYKKAFTDKLLKNQEMDLLFETSLKNEDFKLYLQPKVHLGTGVVCGAEALVRWIHPQKGVIFPSDFIPLFEGNGKICQLDLYMFEKVCQLINRWQEENRQLIPISVNLSRQHYFHNPEFLSTFAKMAEDYHIPPGIIDFELTESIFFETDRFNSVKKSLEEMHQLGFLCSLDDFGVGFSSLGLLKEFDIDTIKFDRQFFLDVSTEKSKTILESLMEMSEKLGIKTVAEGIETQEQLDYLGEISCDIIQGYIFSMPLEVSEFELWLDSLTNRKPVAKEEV
ncbi:MAG: EAL domain-containing protein [Treponema sp.]|nr:EAL domain-containing protein [Treponema sp.]